MYQSIGQLKKCFPEGGDQTLLSNVSQVFFAANDKDTAQYISDRLGEETIIVTSGGTQRGTTHQAAASGPPSFSRSFQKSDNWAPQARRLLKPEEVTALCSRTAITFHPGIPPLKTTLIRYYEENVAGASAGVGEKATTFAWCAMLLVVAFGFAGFVNDNLANRDPIWMNSATEWNGWGWEPPAAVTPRHFSGTVKASKPRHATTREWRRSN